MQAFVSIPDAMEASRHVSLELARPVADAPFSSAFASNHSRRSSSQSTLLSQSSSYSSWSTGRPSSSSPGSLTPPFTEIPETLSMTKRAFGPLPDVEEDPMERDEPAEPIMAPSAQSFPQLRWSEDIHRPSPRHISLMESTDEFEFRILPGFARAYSDDGHFAKRRRSADIFNGVTNKILTRVPSFSRPHKERKRSSISVSNSRGHSPSPSILARARSLTRRSSDIPRDQFEASPSPDGIDTILEDEIQEAVRSSLDLPLPEHWEEIPPEAEVRSSTPLLPPIMTALQEQATYQSPLQSPSYAPAESQSSSGAATPTISPPNSGLTTPPLSSKASVSSFPKSRSMALVHGPGADVPPLMIDTDDEWADKLGHNDYQIHPMPYIPNYCDRHSCEQMFEDWHQARAQYSKHEERTKRHFGTESKVFKLTQAKWASIDHEWKTNYETAKTKACLNGEAMQENTPAEPAPIAKIPTIDDSGMQGKFPKLGDQDIVGPMEVAPPIVPDLSVTNRRKSKKAQFLRLFQFPRSFSAPSVTAGGR